MTQTGFDPLPRCCDNHDDWPTLASHLINAFPAVAAGDVVRELSQAKEATEQFALEATEMFQVAELMARHQLMLMNGDLPDIARLDPERHARRSATA